MSKREVADPSPVAPSALLGDIRALIEAARKRATSTVNSELTMLYWRISQRIHTQVLDGRRSAYGKEILLVQEMFIIIMIFNELIQR